MNFPQPNPFSLLFAAIHDGARRWALVGWAVALLCLTLLYATALLLEHREAAIASLQSELAATKTQLAEASPEPAGNTLVDRSVLPPITSAHDLVSYLSGYGALLLDRQVPKGEQPAFLANLAPDPGVPKWYTSKVALKNGAMKVYTLEVTDAVRFMVPN